MYKFNPNKGEATLVSKTSGVQNPSWLCVTKDGKFVYAVNENGGDKPGELSAFAFDKKQIGKSLQWILLESIGKPKILQSKDIPIQVVKKSLEKVLKNKIAP